VRMKGRQTILGECCTRCMLYTVYAALGVCCTRCYLMIMAWRDREGGLNFVFCDDGRVVDKKERWWMKMGMIWRIRAEMRNQGYDLPDWVWKTSYRCNYSLDRDSYLPYRGWLIDSHTQFSQVPVSHDDFPHLLPSLSFLSSTLPSPKNTKLSHPSLSLHAMIMS